MSDQKVKNRVCFTAKEGLYNHSPYYPEPRKYIFTGHCTFCGRRGPLGDHANDPLIAEAYGKTGSDFPLCAICANTSERYNSALKIAKGQWQ